jgi:thiamine transporter ThiT
MSRNLKIIARVAVFAALVFVFSYFSIFLYNINPSLFIVFMAGFLWGVWPGVGVGVIGFFLWSNFNPLGPAPIPLLLSQLVGISVAAFLGAAIRKMNITIAVNSKMIFILILSGFLTGLIYHIIVDTVDALLYQPFWPRLIGGMLFSLITIVSNSILFPILCPVLIFLYEREKSLQG